MGYSEMLFATLKTDYLYGRRFLSQFKLFTAPASAPSYVFSVYIFPLLDEYMTIVICLGLSTLWTCSEEPRYNPFNRKY